MSQDIDAVSVSSSSSSEEEIILSADQIPKKSPVWRHVCLELIKQGKLDFATFKFEHPLEVLPVGIAKCFLSEAVEEEVEKLKKAKRAALNTPHVNKGKKRLANEDGSFRWVTPEEYYSLKLAEAKKGEPVNAEEVPASSSSSSSSDDA